jgi:hypothetical protein
MKAGRSEVVYTTSEVVYTTLAVFVEIASYRGMSMEEER